MVTRSTLRAPLLVVYSRSTLPGDSKCCTLAGHICGTGSGVAPMPPLRREAHLLQHRPRGQSVLR